MTPPRCLTRAAALGLLASLWLVTPAQAALPPNHDHDLEYLEDTSKDPDALLRAYGRNSHLQKLLDLGLYQFVFDDDPTGVEAFLAAGAKLEGIKELPLSPMAFATWRHETRTIHCLASHGAKPVAESDDADQLARKTVETVMSVTDAVSVEMHAAEAEFRHQRAPKR
jgi:hypothetical protein